MTPLLTWICNSSMQAWKKYIKKYSPLHSAFRGDLYPMGIEAVKKKKAEKQKSKLRSQDFPKGIYFHTSRIFKLCTHTASGEHTGSGNGYSGKTWAKLGIYVCWGVSWK